MEHSQLCHGASTRVPRDVCGTLLIDLLQPIGLGNILKLFSFLFDNSPVCVKFPLQLNLLPLTSTMKTLQKRSWIRHIDDERSIDNGIIISLQKGWAFESDPSCSVMGFDTMSDAIAGTKRDCIIPAAD